MSDPSDFMLTVRSSHTFEKVCEDLPAAVSNHGFGVMTTHDMKATMAKKGVEFTQDCTVFEVCNPHQAKKVLEANLAISTALPCRISVYREGGETVLATIRPSAMLGLFGNEEMNAVSAGIRP